MIVTLKEMVSSNYSSTVVSCIRFYGSQNEIVNLWGKLRTSSQTQGHYNWAWKNEEFTRCLHDREDGVGWPHPKK